MSTKNDALEAEFLEAQIRHELAEAELAELQLKKAQAEERDRVVKVGALRHLDVNALIGGEKHDKWMDAIRHWGMRDPGEPVTIAINTPGGSVVDGLALYDAIVRLREAGSYVTTHAQGVAASMGAVLLQAGSVRLVDRHAKVLIHEGSGQVSGTRGEIEDQQKFHDMLISDILDILAERSKMTRRQIQQKWKRKDWWLSAEESVKFGFADRVV